MATYKEIKTAQEYLIDQWSEKGEEVADKCLHAIPFGDSFSNFLNHCIACGGNWTRMILTGVKKLYPDVWDSIPDDLGSNAFECMRSVLILLGVNTAN